MLHKEQVMRIRLRGKPAKNMHRISKKCCEGQCPFWHSTILVSY